MSKKISKGAEKSFLFKRRRDKELLLICFTTSPKDV
jgi:hypothetical protein